MTAPHPTDAGFAKAFSDAWTHDADLLVDIFAPDAKYTDMAFDASYTGHEEIKRFQRYMLRFSPDTVIEFDEGHAADGRVYFDWVWSGTFSSPLRLRSGALVDAIGTKFSVVGFAACEYREDGKLTRHRDFWDLTTVLHQASIQIG